MIGGQQVRRAESARPHEKEAEKLGAGGDAIAIGEDLGGVRVCIPLAPAEM